MVKARQYELRIDEPSSAGGSDTGPQPTEVFLASVASCFALAVAHVAGKRSIELADLRVRAVGEYDGPKFAKVRVEVTSSHPREELDLLLQRASAVCYVSSTLRTVDDVDVVVVDEAREA